MITSLETLKEDSTDDYSKEKMDNEKSKRLNPVSQVQTQFVSSDMLPTIKNTDVIYDSNSSVNSALNPAICRPSRLVVKTIDHQCSWQQQRQISSSWDPWSSSPLGKANRQALMRREFRSKSQDECDVFNCSSSSITTDSCHTDDISIVTDPGISKQNMKYGLQNFSGHAVQFETPPKEILAKDLNQELHFEFSTCYQSWPPPPSSGDKTCFKFEQNSNKGSAALLLSHGHLTPIAKRSTLNPCTKSFHPVTPEPSLNLQYSVGNSSCYSHPPYRGMTLRNSMISTYSNLPTVSYYGNLSRPTNQAGYLSQPSNGPYGLGFHNQTSSAKRQLFAHHTPNYHRKAYKNFTNYQGFGFQHR